MFRTRWGDVQRNALQEFGVTSATMTPLQDVIDAVRDIGLDPRDVLINGGVAYDPADPDSSKEGE